MHYMRRASSKSGSTRGAKPARQSLIAYQAYSIKYMKFIKSLLAIAFVAATLVVLISCSSDETKIHVHTYEDWQTVKNPTCSEEGLFTRTCTACLHTEELVMPIFEHVYDDGTTIKSASCTERGQINYQCKFCGEIKRTISPKASHTPSEEYVSVGEHHGKQCAVCFALTSKEEHYFENGYCIICNATQYPATGG